MLNRITLIGRLTRDPELHYTPGAESKARASFSLAVDRDFKNKDGNKITDFFDIVAWRKKAEFVSKYFKKGRMVYIEGRLQRDVWDDKDGKKRVTYKIIVENCYFADSRKPQENEQDIKQDDEVKASASLGDYTDDLPF
jgi:single-strand DNA-binding protein